MCYKRFLSFLLVLTPSLLFSPSFSFPFLFPLLSTSLPFLRSRCAPSFIYLRRRRHHPPVGPDTLGSDGSACQWPGVINGEVMDRCAGAAETSPSTFSCSSFARQREGPRAAILCQGRGP